MNILMKNILGEFVIDPTYNITKKDKKHVRDVCDDDFPKVLEGFKTLNYFSQFRDANLKLVKEKIKSSVKEDIFLQQCSSSIEEITKTVNTHTKRLREWVGYPMPEMCEHIDDNEKFVELVIEFTKPRKEDKMSLLIDKEHLLQIQSLAKMIVSLLKEKEKSALYLEKRMEKLCPNVVAVCGASIGAKLFVLAGGFEKLAMAPASKIQLLGAEEALFRHLKTGAKPPKHGVIHGHQFVSKAKRSDRGRAARRLADKISIAVKVDYFKGKFIGDKLKKELKL